MSCLNIELNIQPPSGSANLESDLVLHLSSASVSVCLFMKWGNLNSADSTHVHVLCFGICIIYCICAVHYFSLLLLKEILVN